MTGLLAALVVLLALAFADEASAAFRAPFGVLGALAGAEAFRRGAFLARGRALPGSGLLGRGGLLRRSGGARCRNGGGLGRGFGSVHGGSFLAAVWPRTHMSALWARTVKRKDGPRTVKIEHQMASYFNRANTDTANPTHRCAFPSRSGKAPSHDRGR